MEGQIYGWKAVPSNVIKTQITTVFKVVYRYTFRRKLFWSVSCHAASLIVNSFTIIIKSEHFL